MQMSYRSLASGLRSNDNSNGKITARSSLDHLQGVSQHIPPRLRSPIPTGLEDDAHVGSRLWHAIRFAGARPHARDEPDVERRGRITSNQEESKWMRARRKFFTKIVAVTTWNVCFERTQGGRHQGQVSFCNFCSCIECTEIPPRRQILPIVRSRASGVIPIFLLFFYNVNSYSLELCQPDIKVNT